MTKSMLYTMLASAQYKHWNGSYDVWRSCSDNQNIEVEVEAEDAKDAEAKGKTLLPRVEHDRRWDFAVRKIGSVTVTYSEVTA